MTDDDVRCPGCSGPMRVTRLHCSACRLSVEGSFERSPLARLSPEEGEFVVAFVGQHGSIKGVGRLFGISYPTVKKRLARIAESLAAGVNVPPSAPGSPPTQ